MTDAEVSAKLSGVQNFVSTNTRGGMTFDCDSLLIEDNGGNEFNGNMFDVVVTNEIYLETFSVNTDAGSWNIAIFYRSGSYVGFNQSAAGWTFLDSAVITSTTTDDTILYKIPVNLNLQLAPGTYGFYVTGMANSPFNYTDGTAVGNVAASNSHFSVLEGHGGAYPFNLNNSPRVFNGSLYYCLDVTGVEENLEEDFTIYPNPVNSNVTIDFSSFSGKQVEISLINSIGQVVYNETTNASHKVMDVNPYPSGIYFLNVVAEGKKMTSKLVID